MKLLPDLFNDSFEDFFHDSFFTNQTKHYMKTDISESENSFLLDIELPGYKKEDIQLELKDGYLLVQASRNNAVQEKDDSGNIIRQERFTGTCSRSYYIGESITERDIKAAYDNGELKIEFPKLPSQVQEKKFIPIG